MFIFPTAGLYVVVRHLEHEQREREREREISVQDKWLTCMHARVQCALTNAATCHRIPCRMRCVQGWILA
jgi:hypothetical protein